MWFKLYNLSCNGNQSVTKVMKLEQLWRGPCATHSFPPKADLIERPQGLAYESLTQWCVIIDPSTYTNPLPCHRRPCRQMTAQTGNVWLGYTEQTLAATWWLDMAYICSSHQLVSQHLTPVCLFSITLCLCRSFFPLMFTCPYCGSPSLISR